MDGSMFTDMYRGLFWVCIVVAALGGANCFGAGHYVGKGPIGLLGYPSS
jgi:hypothetical protein